MLPPLTAIPSHVASVSDYRELARERVEPGAWAYLEGGAADEISAAQNLTSFDSCRIIPRHFRDFSNAHTRTELFGRRYAHPIFVAPTAYHRLFHPEGELASLLGATALEAGFTLSTLASASLEEIGAQKTAGLWFQLYIQHDREFTLELVGRAEKAGYEALVLTADAPLSGLRNREQRAGFQMPAHISAVNLKGMRPQAPAQQIFGSELLKQSPTWNDLAWLAENTRLPIILKGVLHPDDARSALDHGASGIIVSNHGGRILDTTPTPFEVLPVIAKAVAGAAPVLVDGGIRRGSDIFKALCSGADAVMIGRPILHGLAAAGAVGVAHVIKMLRTELEMTMALAGCPDLSSVNPGFLLEKR
ncbi:alpha-hydroxy acid oxidase [Haloferula chungangensis]|uniref:Alpha-hydroxy acid oxidase n=1 Tax=Haloferula chungangensis TaxID=1048331 RepID=A0ABW2L532_9BACT